MTIKELKEALAAYPDDMEVVVFIEGHDDHPCEFNPDFSLEINDDNQLVID